MSGEHFDVVVIGLGPAGATTSAYLARAGLSVLALERQAFPRFHIGESLTGIAGDVLRDLGLDGVMPDIGAQPKSGVQVVGAEAQSRFFVPTLRETWQVRRSAFDALLADHAASLGVVRREGNVEGLLREGERVCGVGYRPHGAQLATRREVSARFVIDCSGQSTLLARHGVAGARRDDAFGRQIAVFTQLEGVQRDSGPLGDATQIFYQAPFHWAWLIPIDSQVHSLGIVTPRETHRRIAGRADAVLRWGMEAMNPALRSCLEGAQPKGAVRAIRNYSYRVEPFVGPGWLCVGDAHRFTDPIFSYGVALAMAEGRIAAEMVADVLQRGCDERVALQAYAAYADRGQDAAADLIRYFWSYPAFFAYQTRGSLRDDFVRLFAGDFFGETPLPALDVMRRSLAQVPVPLTASALDEAPPDLPIFEAPARTPL